MIRQLRDKLPARTRWLLCVLGAASCMLAVTIGVTVGDSAQASVNPGTSKTVNARTITVSPTVAADYTGGHYLAAASGGGYWTVDWLGDVTSHGGAPLFGSPVLSGVKLAQPIVAIMGTPDGQGYWLVASDGGVLTYGDAKFYGSTGASSSESSDRRRRSHTGRAAGTGLSPAMVASLHSVMPRSTARRAR